MIPHLNKRLVSLEESATVALADRVRKLKASGRSIIALQTGDPDFATPESIVAAANLAIRDGQTHYCDSRGLPELRHAISNNLSRKYGVHYDPDAEILVTCGGIHAYYCALVAVLNPGDEVLVPDPAWMPHSNTVSLVGGTPVRVPSSVEERFFPNMSAWEQRLTSRTVALVINSPNNPTGMVAPRDYLEQLVRFAEENDLLIISDEVYDGIVFDGHQHTCVATLPDAKNRTLTINSFSKTYAMTGWRIGYLAAPSIVIDQALKASQFSITNVPSFTQIAASFALGNSEVSIASKKMASSYERRKNDVMLRWNESLSHGVRIREPQGAFYFFLDVRELGMSSVDAASFLLDEHSVAVVPGSAYGQCGEGFLRLTIAAKEVDIHTGFERIAEWAASTRQNCH